MLFEMWCRQLKAEAEEKTNGVPDEELQAAFCALSANLEKLQTDVVRLRAEAEGIACANPRVVRVFTWHEAARLPVCCSYCVSVAISQW